MKRATWVGAVAVGFAGAVTIALVAPPSPAVASAAKAPAVLAGELPKSLATMSGSELLTFGEQLVFTGGIERARMCSGTPECDAGVARTSAHIEAVDQAPIGASNTPSAGAIILRVQNTGSFTERRYGLAPGTLAYLIATPDVSQATTGRWSLVQVDGGTKTVLASGVLSSCGHGVYSGRPRADFRTCAAARSTHLNGALTSPASIHVGDNDPMWLFCEEGCCWAAEQ